jgi:hypothetical protein
METAKPRRCEILLEDRSQLNPYKTAESLVGIIGMPSDSMLGFPSKLQSNTFKRLT